MELQQLTGCRGYLAEEALIPQELEKNEGKQISTSYFSG